MFHVINKTIVKMHARTWRFVLVCREGLFKTEEPDLMVDGRAWRSPVMGLGCDRVIN